jgi:adenylate cyclase
LFEADTGTSAMLQIAGIPRIRDSFLIARITAFTFSGKSVDAKAIGKDSGVRYKPEGSVQPSGA